MNDATLTATDLMKSFGDHQVLKGLSLEAKSGDVIAMLGASGSGKSTFLRCLNLLEIPDSGRITLRGEEMQLKPGRNGKLAIDNPRQIERMRSKLAMVFQQFNLWSHMTVLDNVIEAPVQVLKKDRKTAIDEARRLLDKVGILDRADYYPNHLSGGQQQRVAIARALAMEPDVLLFDEPTSALDPELVSEVLKVMRDLAGEGRTMIVVTHEMSFARDVASEIVFLHEGNIEARGDPHAMFSGTVSDRFDRFLQGLG